ncbi:DUF6603 domain-containing protein [Nisaea sp.]|uniref:DUF6603 domain-containing protein n=1 Tax=Nisaea sp. TaxID=2024842 RepID=UPI003265999D
MTIQQLKDNLQGFISDGTFVMPADAFGAGGIEEIVGANFANDKLIIDGAELTSEMAIVTIAGTASFVSVDDMAVSAVFRIVDGDVTLTLAATLPASWKFSQSFPALTNTLFDGLTLTGPKMILSSVDQTSPANLARGLNFQGSVSGGLPEPLPLLPTPLTSIAGPIPIDHGVPAMTLALGPSVEIRFGSEFSLPAVHCELATRPIELIKSHQHVWSCTNLVTFKSQVKIKSKPVFLSGSYSAITENLMIEAVNQSVSLADGISDVFDLIGWTPTIDWPPEFHLDNIYLSDLRMIAAFEPGISLESFSFGVVWNNASWDLIPGMVTLKKICVGIWISDPLNRRTREHGGQIYGQFLLGSSSGAIINLYATMPSKPGAGWSFAGNIQPGTVLDMGKVVEDFSTTFGVTLPDVLKKFALKNLYIVFTPTSHDVNGYFTVDFTVGTTPVEMDITASLTKGGGNYSSAVTGHLLIGASVFDIAFSHHRHSTTFQANWSDSSDPLQFSDLARMFGFTMPTVPSDLDLSLTSASFIYDFSSGTLVLGARSKHYGNAVFACLPVNDHHECFFLLGADESFSLSNLPLVGEDLAGAENVQVGDLQIIIGSAAAAAAAATSINSLIESLPAPTGPSYPQMPPHGTTGDLVLSAIIELGDRNVPVMLGMGGSSSHNGHDTDAAVEGVGVSGSTALASAGSGSGSASAAGRTEWITVQKSFGPLSIQKIGVKYQSASQRLWFDIDATLQVGPVSVTLDNLGIGSSLTDFDPQVSLEGLGVSYDKPPLAVSGSFANLNPEHGFEFDGSAAIGTDNFELEAIGFYGNQTGSPSMFIYGDLARSFGGPPAFFVTGVALGFGYNSVLRLPNVDQVAKFPLLEMLPDSLPPTTSPAPATPQAALNQLLTTNPPWVTETPGAMWFAAGLTFTSFELVNSQAVVIVEPGPDLTISLVGTSRAKFPQDSGRGGTTYAYLELDLDANFKPEEGAFSLQAVLSPSSYLLDRACVLTGGFAFDIWFGDNEHAGDFVLTLGGYNAHFTPPAYYPSVPRLGFHWSLDSSITVSGNAYLAFTPSVMMVGGELNAVYHSGNLRAWFDAQADIIVQWKPFWFDANIRISVGASYRIDLLFTSFTVSVELGCDLELWGPPTGGHVHVDWYIISFTIPFGASRSAGASHLTWNDVQAMLPNAGTATHPNILSLTPTGGIAPSSAEAGSSGWIVRGSQFGFATTSSIPATTATVGARHTFNGDTFNVAPLGWTDISAAHKVAIEDGGGNDYSASFNAVQARKSLPSSLWGSPPTTTPSGRNQLVADQITGVTVLVKPPQIGSSAGPVSVDLRLEGVPLSLTGAGLPVANDATPSGDVPANSQTTISTITNSQSGISASSTATARDDIYAALQTVGYAPVTANDSMEKFANGIGCTFRASPLLVA